MLHTKVSLKDTIVATEFNVSHSQGLITNDKVLVSGIEISRMVSKMGE